MSHSPQSLEFFIVSSFLSDAKASAILLLAVCVLMVFGRRLIHRHAALAMGGLATAGFLYLVIYVWSRCGTDFRCVPPPAGTERWWESYGTGFIFFMYVVYVGPLVVAVSALLTWVFWRRVDAEGAGQSRSSKNVSVRPQVAQSAVGHKKMSEMTDESGAKFRMKGRGGEVQGDTLSWWDAGTHRRWIVRDRTVQAVRDAFAWLNPHAEDIEMTESRRAIAALIILNVAVPLAFRFVGGGDTGDHAVFAIAWQIIGVIPFWLVNGFNFWLFLTAPKYRNWFGIAILLNTLAVFLGSANFVSLFLNWHIYYTTLKQFQVI